VQTCLPQNIRLDKTTSWLVPIQLQTTPDIAPGLHESFQSLVKRVVGKRCYEGMSAIKTENETTRRLQSEARRKLPFLLEFGNEGDIIAYARAWNPKLSEQQLNRIVKLFLDAKRERAHSRQFR